MMKTKDIFAVVTVISVLFNVIESSTVKLAPWPAEYETNNAVTIRYPQQQQQPDQQYHQQPQPDEQYHQQPQPEQQYHQPPQHETDTVGCDDDLRIISKREWGGRSPKREPTPLDKPVEKIIIQSTYTNKCSTKEACAHLVRSIQTTHMVTRKWNDIGYNFLVGGDGAVYVGRGWNMEGAHTRGHNRKSICIAFIGNFDSIAPPTRQLCAAQNLIAEGIRLEVLSDDYKLYGHRQLVSTDSPGAALYEIIKTWDHWTAQVN